MIEISSGPEYADTNLLPLLTRRGKLRLYRGFIAYASGSLSPNVKPFASAASCQQNAPLQRRIFKKQYLALCSRLLGMA